MAHALKIKYGSPASWAYIDLTDSNHGIVDYVPGTPGEGADEIVESGRFRVAGSSVADLITKIGEIEQVFYKAGQFGADGIGAWQVWVTIQPSEVSETWESQVFEGRLELTEDVLGVDWANRATEVVLIWRRCGWWERYAGCGPTNDNVFESIPIVFNSNDGTGSYPLIHENWVDIPAAGVGCDLPAPATITLGPTTAIDTVEMFLNAKTAPEAMYMAEGETGTGDTTDANRSKGKYKIYTTPAGGTTGVDVRLPAPTLGVILNGAWLRFSLSAKFSGTVYARPFIEIGGKKYYGSKSILTGAGADFYAYDLGMVRFPHSGRFNSYSAFADGFNAPFVGINFIAASAVAVSVDYFLYIPIDGYAKAVLDTTAAAYIIIDTRAGMALANANLGSENKISSIGTLWGGIWLEPNTLQRISFKLTAGGLDVMATKASLQMSAWLRKRTL